jgi:hypothetical protein
MMPQVPSGQWEEGVAPQYAPEVSEYACAGGARVLQGARCSSSVEAAVRSARVLLGLERSETKAQAW